MEIPRYVQALRAPEPALPSGLRLVSPVDKAVWKMEYRVGGAGWYWDRFLFLFGAGVADLDRCLGAWAPLCGTDEGRVILGRNAHGAILVLDGTHSATAGRIRILDPFQVSYAGRERVWFPDLFSTIIPDNVFPTFFSNRLYAAWRKREGRPLGEQEILAPKVPEAAGGRWELDNLAVEDLDGFYERTAQKWAPHIAVSARRKQKRRDVWL